MTEFLKGAAVCLVIACASYAAAHFCYRLGVAAGRRLSAVERADIKYESYQEGRHAAFAFRAACPHVAPMDAHDLANAVLQANTTKP